MEWEDPDDHPAGLSRGDGTGCPILASGDGCVDAVRKEDLLPLGPGQREKALFVGGAYCVGGFFAEDQDVLQPLIASGRADVELVPNPKHERKAGLMASAAVVVVPIQWPEPFGMVMPEANACGTPVVAFDMGAAREVIADGKTGFVVPPGDVNAFCAAVDQTKELLPIDCRTHVVERFSVQRMVADYEKVYDAASIIDLRTPTEARIPIPRSL